MSRKDHCGDKARCFIGSKSAHVQERKQGHSRDEMIVARLLEHKVHVAWPIRMPLE